MEKEKVKFYKSKWFMWVCLILLPPVGIVLLWAFHKNMKKIVRIILTIIFVFWFLILIASTSGDTSDIQSNSTTTTQQTTQSETSTTKATTTTTETTTKPITQTTTKSKLEADGISFHISNVRNDVTGNWRVALIAENIHMQDYALDYYKEYFKDDKEIHAIVNFNYNTTSKINVYGNTIYVTVYEYVEGEEHDAKLMFSGMVLKEYSVDIETGNIEEIQ